MTNNELHFKTIESLSSIGKSMSYEWEGGHYDYLFASVKCKKEK